MLLRHAVEIDERKHNYVARQLRSTVLHINRTLAWDGSADALRQFWENGKRLINQLEQLERAVQHERWTS